MSNTMNERQQV